MTNKVLEYIKSQSLFNLNERILLTVSGGADSVVMADIFYKLNINIAIAHCNFKLRGEDSENDKIFVEKLAEKYNVTFHSIDFETVNYAEENKLSIESAARVLRYNWFEKIREQNNYNYIATAHHANDNTETFFINLTAGTGIRGLSAIKAKNNYIIRPLLFMQRLQIEEYCTANNIDYRIDKSNLEIKHTRNKFRHNIIPRFREINPSFDKQMQKNISILNDIEKIYNSAILKFKKRGVRVFSNHVKIGILELMNTEAPATYLFEVIRNYNFNSIQAANIIEKINGNSGKVFLSNTHRLIKSRNFLIINDINYKVIHKIKILESTTSIKIPINIIFELINVDDNFKIERDSKIAYIDADKISYPLFIESWQEGDYFYPIGMKGKKLLSKFFTDIKLNILEKQEALLLKSESNIIWVVGKRLDDRYKVTEKTTRVLVCKTN